MRENDFQSQAFYLIFFLTICVIFGLVLAIAVIVTIIVMVCVLGTLIIIFLIPISFLFILMFTLLILANNKFILDGLVRLQSNYLTTSRKKKKNYNSFAILVLEYLF